MKLGANVLLEIVGIVQDGLVNGTDVSQKLRDLDLEVDPDDPTRLRLSDEYLKSKGPQDSWE